MSIEIDSSETGQNMNGEHPAVAALWDAWDVLAHDNGDPSPTDISLWSADSANEVETLSASTIRGWLSRPRTTVPKWKYFVVLLKYIDSLNKEKTPEHIKKCWGTRWHCARDAREAELASRKKQHPGETPDLTSEQEGVSQGETGQQDGPPAPERPRKKGNKGAVALVGTVFTLAFGTLLLRGCTDTAGEAERSNGKPGASSQPENRSLQPAHTCAYVNKDTALVFPIPDSRSKHLKAKYMDEPIEIMTHRPRTPGWLAVRTPHDGTGVGWMQAERLSKPATTSLPCSQWAADVLTDRASPEPGMGD